MAYMNYSFADYIGTQPQESQGTDMPQATTVTNNTWTEQAREGALRMGTMAPPLNQDAMYRTLQAAYDNDLVFSDGTDGIRTVTDGMGVTPRGGDKMKNYKGFNLSFNF